MSAYPLEPPTPCIGPVCVRPPTATRKCEYGVQSSLFGGWRRYVPLRTPPRDFMNSAKMAHVEPQVPTSSITMVSASKTAGGRFGKAPYPYTEKPFVGTRSERFVRETVKKFSP